MVIISSENFESEVLSSPVPVLVDFFASWCGPCRMVAPILESLSQDLDGKVKFVKLDVDQSADIAHDYNVMSIPTLIIFKDGEEIAKTVGAAGGEELEEWINSNI